MQDDQRFERIRASYSIRSYLESVGVKADRLGVFRCVSPSHEDRTPSAKINPSNPELWQCFGCGERGDVVDLRALHEGCTIGEAASRFDGGVRPDPAAPKPPPRVKPDLRIVRGEYGPIPEDAPKPDKGHLDIWRNSKDAPDEWTMKRERIAHLYEYRDRHGVLQSYVIRQEWLSKVDNKPMKRIIPVRWNVAAKRFDMVGFANKEDRPLFNEDQLFQRPNAQVLMVEGEKSCRIAEALFPEMVCLTWIGGTGQVKDSDFSVLTGRHVTLWPDNDKPGLKAMEHIASKANAGTLMMVPIDDTWLPKWDIEDVAGTSPGAAQGVLQARQPFRVDVAPRGTRPGQWERVSDGGWVPDHVDLILWNDRVSSTSLVNIGTGFRYHPVFASLHWDIVKQCVVFQGEPYPADLPFDPLLARLHTETGLYVNTGWERKLIEAARAKPVNTLADKIRACQWDGVARVERLFLYFGLPVEIGDSHSWNVVGPKRWFLGLVNRVLNPGIKQDLILVLEGDQGVGKSSALEILGSAFGHQGYASISSLGNGRGNDNDLMALRTKTVIELGEMMAVKKSDVDHLKDITSRTIDRYRIPFEPAYVDVPRSASFAGTTNRRDPYLLDGTGGRRFVPVEILNQMQLGALQDDIEQLYAEAALMLDNGEQPFFTDVETVRQDKEIAKRTQTGFMKEKLEGFFEALDPSRTFISKADVWAEAGAIEVAFRDLNWTKIQLDSICAELGWFPVQRSPDEFGRRRSGYTKGQRKRGRPPNLQRL